MVDTHKHIMPKGAKYPLFFLGLLIMIGGGVAAQTLSLPFSASVVTAVVGFIVLMISIVIN